MVVVCFARETYFDTQTLGVKLAGIKGRIGICQKGVIMMLSVGVDFSKPIGGMKPVHGVNNGPVTGHFQFDATEHFKEAGFPFSRLHDSEYPYGAGEFVDISCVFKNFTLPADDPKSYNFTFTDEYLKAILETPAKIIYRLGQTIEHAPIKLHVYPPEDYQKWAEIAEHIIRHYNEGWADGYHMNIAYWEIWNEPDLGPQCWAGDRRDYPHFYKQVATHLKKCFPNLKIGGPAITHAAAHEFIEHFFEVLTSGDRAPLDFFSWHGYEIDPKKSSANARVIDNYLKKYGYDKTQNIYDEWNYVKSWDNIAESYKVISSLMGAAHCAGTLIELQNSPCDIAAYYDAQTPFQHSYCGLFEAGQPVVHGKKIEVLKKKPFYAFKAFNQLYRLGTQAQASCKANELYTLAAADGCDGAVLISNFTQEAVEVVLSISGFERVKSAIFMLDDTHDLEQVATALKPRMIISMPKNAVCLVKCTGSV